MTFVVTEACIQHIYALSPNIYIESLTPDFGGRLDLALDILSTAQPDVLNHNIETVPRLNKKARLGEIFKTPLIYYSVPNHAHQHTH
jgi:lipoic acid synthetase